MVLIANTNVKAQFDWEDIFIQGGDSGTVFTNKGAYTTAFVEAFPKELKTFIRGEGATIEEAEKDAWNQYQRILKCKGHDFERRGYKNGAGFCKHCDLFQGKVFEPSEQCAVCGCNTFWIVDKDGKYYCEAHKNDIPEDKRFKFF